MIWEGHRPYTLFVLTGTTFFKYVHHCVKLTQTIMNIFLHISINRHNRIKIITLSFFGRVHQLMFLFLGSSAN